MIRVLSRAERSQIELPRYRPDIDGLRALAVLAVVGFHAFPGAIPGGFAGVDIFFVISGYLISGILLAGFEKNTFSFADFYARRVRRIFPALIAVMAVCFAFGFLLSPREFMDLCKHIAGGAGFVSNFVLWREAGYFDTISATKPLLHLWSLGIEEQFYIVWPPLLYLIWKLRRNFLIPAVLAVIASFAFNVVAAQYDAVGDFYSPASRFWEISLGSVIACLHFYKSGVGAKLQGNEVLKNIPSVAGLVLIAASVCLFDKENAYPGWYALAPTMGACLLIASGSGAWLNRAFLARPVLVWLGLISFPLYLWHWPLLVFMRISAGETPDVFARAGAVIASIILAWLTYSLIEKPIRFGRHSKTQIAVICGLMALIGVAAFCQYQNLKSELGSDQPEWAYWHDDACKKKYHGVDPCQANSEAPTVAILGDSHGNQLYPGLALTQPTMEMLAAGPCLPLAGIFLHVRRNQNLNVCEDGDYFALYKKILRENPQIKTVIISGRWRHVLTGRIGSAREREAWGGVSLSSDVPGEEGKSAAELVDLGLARFIGYLKSQNLKVIFIRSTPEIDPELEDYCHLRSEGPPAECSIPKADVLGDRKGEDRMIAVLKQKFPGLPIYDPFDALCIGAKCYLVKDGTLLYRDNHHLNYEGSVYLGRKIKEWMREKNLLPGKAN